MSYVWGFALGTEIGSRRLACSCSQQSSVLLMNPQVWDSDITQQRWFLSTPRCLGPQLVGLERLEARTGSELAGVSSQHGGFKGVRLSNRWLRAPNEDPRAEAEAAYDLASEVPECHFCRILFGKQVTVASPSSMGVRWDSVSYREEQWRVCSHLCFKGIYVCNRIW